ncbi:MAG: AAA family ATPase, partial [Phycisphaerae bacterium]
MILKKLTATGFKSFADKTEFEFDGGITCVVGPNGCGKSNVVDAIKWVLGEQSAKSLRGHQMLDVIFKGSRTRKGSGMAQVDLTFDNSDGTLPIDQTEVVVTRRLYRSGESEYLLNQQAARLKDVRELFLDTGIGLDAYSVIEQGKVDVLLQANPSERRAIFEEAAGINKYKVRKKEALRRLDRVNQNLLRVQDIVEEVEKRLRSVKLAAGKARNYQTYVERLSTLRSRYALSEYHRLRVAADALEREASELSDDVTRIRTDLSDNDAKSSRANVRIVDLERETQQIETRLLTVQSQVTAHEERIAAAERRIEDQQGLLERSRERLSGFDDRTATLDARLSEQRRTSESIETDLAEARSEQDRHAEEDTGCAHALNEKRAQLDESKENIIELVRRSSQLHNEIQGLGLQQDNMIEQKRKLDARDAQIASELEGAVTRQTALRDRRSEISSRIEEQSRRLETVKTRIGEVAGRRASLLDQLAAAKEYRSGLESRRQLLEEMDQRHEGLLAGAREILERRDAGRKRRNVETSKRQNEDGSENPGAGLMDSDPIGIAVPAPFPQEEDTTEPEFEYVLGAVGELFETDVAHAGMVEAVLGHHETYLVASHRDRLLSDQETLVELKGRVQAFCLDAVPAPIAGPDLCHQEGFIAHLLDWVRYPDECKRLARHLFGRAWVVESVEAAARMAPLDPQARFVTMEGIVIEPDGRLGIGSLGSDTGLISRRSELRELAKELDEAACRIDELAATLQQSETEAGRLEDEQQSLRTAVYEENTRRVETQAALTSVDDTVRLLSEERPLIASEISVLVSRLDEIREQREADRRTLTIVEQHNLEGEQLVGRLQVEITELSARREAIAERMTEARVRVGELSQRRAGMAESIRELDAARIQLNAERDKADRDVTEARERIEQSRTQIEETKTELGELTRESGDLRHRGMAARQERDDLRAALDQYAKDARRLRGDLESIESRLHERQMKIQEARVRIEDLTARIAEELSVDLAEQYEDYQPDEEEDWPAVEAEIEDLRGKIERLG